MEIGVIKLSKEAKAGEPIHLTVTEEEARLFLDFQQNYEMIQTLKKAKVFNIKSGRAELHFNPSGVLTAVDIHLRSFKR